MALWMIAAPQHAAFVALLAAAAWLVSRGLRWAALGHAAWILVLVKLLTPPLFALPTPEGWPAVQNVLSQELSVFVAAAWIVGSIGAGGLMLIRGLKFQRLLNELGTISPLAEHRTRTLAGRLGLRRVPKVRLLDVQTTPLVWGVGRSATVVFPSRLWDQSSPVQRDAMLIHELAHVRRGDPWVRVLEAAALVLFWWHPAVWIARREIAVCEEECCDAAAVEAFEHAPRAYAESLLEALEFAAGPPKAALATGVRSASTIKQRLTRIMLRTPTRSGRAARLALTLVALIALPLDLSPQRAPTTDNPLRQASKDANPTAASPR
jgi:beta-lactamase regulating signal transducer with metallopeptidase domain